MIYKSRKFKILLILVAFAFIAISALLSIAYVNGKYYRSLTQNISLEAHPNNPYSYYLYDANGESTGVYNSKETISQNIKVRTTKEETIYQIKIPVITTGYYDINFQVDFLKPGDTQASSYLILSDRMYNPIGCQVVHQSTHPFGSSTSKLVMLEKSEKEFIGNMVTHDMEQLITATDHYQWKTLAPSL